MNQDTLAPHETLELHELLRSKQIEIKKIQTNLAMVRDESLREFMKDCLESSRANMRELMDLSQNSTMEIGGA